MTAWSECREKIYMGETTNSINEVMADGTPAAAAEAVNRAANPAAGAEAVNGAANPAAAAEAVNGAANPAAAAEAVNRRLTEVRTPQLRQN